VEGCLDPDAVSGPRRVVCFCGFLWEKADAMRKFANGLVKFLQNEDGPTA
jgi:hypothetical protein